MSLSQGRRDIDDPSRAEPDDGEAMADVETEVGRAGATGHWAESGDGLVERLAVRAGAPLFVQPGLGDGFTHS